MKSPTEKPATPQMSQAEIPAEEGWTHEACDMKDEFGNDVTLHHLWNPDTDEGFLLSNRTFEQIDGYSSYKFLALLIKKIKENPGRQIVVLDIGGGVMSENIRGMLRHPYLKGKIKCVNVDLFVRKFSPEELEEEGINPKDISILREDFLETTLEEGTADVIFSYQVLDYVRDDKFYPFIDKAAKMLANGGEAYLDEYWKLTRWTGMDGGFMVLPYPPDYSSEVYGGSPLHKIAYANHVLISSTFKEETLDGQLHIFGAPHGLLHIGKPYDSPQGHKFPDKRDHRLAYPEIIKAVKAYE